MDPKKVPVRIITKSGSRVNTQVYIVTSKDNGSDEDMLFWRPDVGLNVLLIENLQLDEALLTVYFPPNFELKLEFFLNQTAIDFYDHLNSILNPNNNKKDILPNDDVENGKNDEVVTNNSKTKVKFSLGRQTSQFNSNRMLENHLPIEIAFLLEKGHQSLAAIKFNDGALILEPFLLRIVKQLLKNRFNKWAQYTKLINNQAMMADRKRWRFHAIVNQDIDLQAWYHAVFYKEVYRPRGQFWYRDAVLPIYRNSYDLVDNTLSPMEEAALAHVLCSPETSYGDVAGQMFVVQSIVKKPQLFTIFQKLSAQGATVIKFPKTGNPSKKLFRFSFVEGNIYLTWKGKYGNQGVDLADVTAVNIGISTDTLKKAYAYAMSNNNNNSSNNNSQQSSKSPADNNSNSTTTTTTTITTTTTTTPMINVEDLYLSIISGGKSIDLCLPTIEDRDCWKELLDVLTRKENGYLSQDMDPLITPRVVGSISADGLVMDKERGGGELMESSLVTSSSSSSHTSNNNSSNNHNNNNSNSNNSQEESEGVNNNNNCNNNDEDSHSNDSFEWLLWYSSLGEKVLPIPVRQSLFNQPPPPQQKQNDDSTQQGVKDDDDDDDDDDDQEQQQQQTMESFQHSMSVLTVNDHDHDNDHGTHHSNHLTDVADYSNTTTNPNPNNNSADTTTADAAVAIASTDVNSTTADAAVAIASTDVTIEV